MKNTWRTERVSQRKKNKKGITSFIIYANKIILFILFSTIQGLVLGIDSHGVSHRIYWKLWINIRALQVHCWLQWVFRLLGEDKSP